MIVSSDRRKAVWSMTLLYGAVHLLVDAASVTFYFALLHKYTSESPWDIFALYVIFAFAMQVPFGLLADRINRPIFVAILGCLLVAVGPFFVAFPFVSLFVLCFGNALFHVGGGVIALTLSRGRAAIPGMFVAPGVFGVAIGVTLGGFRIFPHIVFCIIFALAVILLYLSRHLLQNDENQTNESVDMMRTKPVAPLDYTNIAVILFFVVIVSRAIVADFVSDIARANISWSYALPIAVFLGKFFGGFLADRFGWQQTVLTAIVCSVPLIAIGEYFSFLLLPGAFLFTMSMPITLTALGNLLPRQPGFAFGLTALAIAVGALSTRIVHLQGSFVFFMIFLTASLFYCAVRLYNQSIPRNDLFTENNLTENIP